MTTPTRDDLEAFAVWLEKHRLCAPKRREVTMSYLSLVFSRRPLEEMRLALRFLRARGTNLPSLPWIVLPGLSQAWAGVGWVKKLPQ